MRPIITVTQLALRVLHGSAFFLREPFFTISVDVIDTENDLAVDSEGYQHITVAWQPAQPSLEFLRYLTNQISAGDTPGDCIPPP